MMQGGEKDEIIDLWKHFADRFTDTLETMGLTSDVKECGVEDLQFLANLSMYAAASEKSSFSRSASKLGHRSLRALLTRREMVAELVFSRKTTLAR